MDPLSVETYLGPMPAARPRSTSTAAIFREASSIISSPSMTAPVSPLTVARSYASTITLALSKSYWEGAKIAFRTSAWTGLRAHFPS